MDIAQQLQSTDPYLPPDLEREIFETTAIRYPATIPKLLRVAHRVLGWLEPMLFTVVRITGLEEKDAGDKALLRAIETRPDFFPHTVRHMYLFPVHWSFFGARRSANAWSDLELQTALRACRDVANLFLLGNPTTPSLHPILEMRPKRLFMFVSVRNRAMDLSLPFFQHITHLLLGDMDGPERSIQLEGPQLQQLCHLPVLTHLAFALNDVAPSAELLSTIMTYCARLQALLLLGGIDHDPMTISKALAEDVSLHDPRVVILSNEDFNKEWYLSTRGHPDMWARADAFISAKRTGEIDGPCYYLEPVAISSTGQDPADIRTSD
ncbi:hypothetical protein FB451DRAFT_1375386 [Mycena latifolia]|nr:hypothetical protein FB451DRAFT_1375386 [Mycena latifolia]